MTSGPSVPCMIGNSNERPVALSVRVTVRVLLVRVINKPPASQHAAHAVVVMN